MRGETEGKKVRRGEGREAGQDERKEIWAARLGFTRRDSCKS